MCLGKKCEEQFSSHENVDVPNVNKTEYQVIDTDGDNVSLMDVSGKQGQNVVLPLATDVKNILGDAMAGRNEKSDVRVSIITVTKLVL